MKKRDQTPRGAPFLRRLPLHRWFPHVPIGILVATIGILHLVPAFHHILGRIPFFDAIADTEQKISQFTVFSMRGLPAVAPGVFLIVMSIGLLMRSRLSWFITVIFLMACTVVDVINYRHPMSPMLILVDSALLAVLFWGRRRFDRSSLAASTLFSIVSLVSLLGYAVIGTYEMGADFSPKIADIKTALYFAIVTMGTVGYGDITPSTTESRMFVVSIIILGITVFATSMSAMLLPLINRRMKRMLERKDSPMERSEHFIIVGDSALSMNTYRQLKNRKESVTVILPKISEGSMFEHEDLIVGMGNDLDALKQAGAERARAVLALGENDSENAFVVLAAKEISAKLTTVIGVNHTANLQRVRRVGPDIVISPQVLGAEILIRALTGESFDSDMILARLFQK